MREVIKKPTYREQYQQNKLDQERLLFMRQLNYIIKNVYSPIDMYHYSSQLIELRRLIRNSFNNENIRDLVYYYGHQLLWQVNTLLGEYERAQMNQENFKLAFDGLACQWDTMTNNRAVNTGVLIMPNLVYLDEVVSTEELIVKQPSSITELNNAKLEKLIEEFNKDLEKVYKYFELDDSLSSYYTLKAKFNYFKRITIRLFKGYGYGIYLLLPHVFIFIYWFIKRTVQDILS